MSATIARFWPPRWRRIIAAWRSHFARKPVTPDCPADVTAEGTVRTLQKDGRLLMRHLARRSDVSVDQLAATGGTAAEPCIDVLLIPPKTIADDALKVAELIHTVDVMSRRARPANARSIRLTSAYLRMTAEDGEPPPQIQDEAEQIRRHIKVLAAVGIAAFMLAIVLLIDADHGRRLLQQVGLLRQMERENTAALSNLPDENFRQIPILSPAAAAPVTGSAAVKLSGARCGDGHTAQTGPWQQPVSATATELCRQKDDIRNRINLTYVALAEWNCWNYQINWLWASLNRGTVACGMPLGETAETMAEKARLAARVSPFTPGLVIAQPTPIDADAASPLSGTGATPPRPPGTNATLPRADAASAGNAATPALDPVTQAAADLTLWRSHETRISLSISVLTGFILPMLLGFLGGCAYVFRHFDEKLTTWSVEPHDGKHAWVRALLAALLGGLVGVVWTSDEPVRIGGFSLSLAATAFFVGFAVEMVFTLLQNLISGAFSAITGPAKTSESPSPVTIGQVRRITQETMAKAAAPVAGANDGAANDGAATASDPSPLPAIADRLGRQRQVLEALVRTGTGSPVVANASAALDAINRTLQIIQPVLDTKPGSPGIAAAVQQAGAALKLAENAGLPGLLADGVATLQGVAGFAAPVLAGIPGGPVGIIGGIVLGGLQLLDNEQKFQAMKAALLRKPFDPDLRPRVPDAPTALATLEASPLMSARVPRSRDPDFAMQLMQRVLEQDTGHTLTAASQLAVTLLQPTDPLGLAGCFESPAELAMAIEEYRGGVVFAEASKQLDGSVAILDPETGVTGNFDLRELARRAAVLHADPLASAAIEDAVTLAETLRKLPFDPAAVTEAVRQALAKVPAIVAEARQVMAA